MGIFGHTNFSFAALFHSRPKIDRSRRTVMCREAVKVVKSGQSFLDHKGWRGDERGWEYRGHDGFWLFVAPVLVEETSSDGGNLNTLRRRRLVERKRGWLVVGRRDSSEKMKNKRWVLGWLSTLIHGREKDEEQSLGVCRFHWREEGAKGRDVRERGAAAGEKEKMRKMI
ncbi:hypothetical protein HAX54_027021 [Datura stramonium]|uniref:Uncharacterized protein n=1 Tax=Datura stramonium TaxID=4076 RepID=A0ABS8V343_DATST|nr:hypothetical protein [Datura stramonium]